MTTVAVIFNPRAGKDQWRVSRSAVPSEAARVAQLRSLLVGAAEGGAERILLSRDPYGLSRRAVGGLQADVRVDLLDTASEFSGSDSTRAAGLMRDKGARVVVVAGGDGTVRDVCRGWRDAPIITIATGTNAAFADRIEPSVAGMCAGVVASLPTVPRELIAHRALAIHVDIDDTPRDLAVVSVSVMRREPATGHIADVVAAIETVLVAVAEPWNTGISSIAGLVAPTPRTDDRAVLIDIGEAEGRSVRAPVAPSEFIDVGLRSVSVLEPSQRVHVKGPGFLALDGDLAHELAPGQRATLSVRRDGPRVIDVRRVYAYAVRRGLFIDNAIELDEPATPVTP